MKKQKNLKNKNMKVSNFVMKLGMVSTVVGTVAASVGVSQIQKEEVPVVVHDLMATPQKSIANSKTLLKNKMVSRGGETGFSTTDKHQLTEGWNTRIHSDATSSSPTSTVGNQSVVSEKTISNAGSIQKVTTFNYDFETTHSHTVSIDANSLKPFSAGGSWTRFFETSTGTLWATGTGLKLFRSDDQGKTWAVDPSSNLTEGTDPTFFEDSSGNLWVSGVNDLREMKKGTNTWSAPDPSSKWTNGASGILFEDSRGNIWAGGRGGALQKLPKGKTTWEDASKHGSTIISSGVGGMNGKMIEDDFGHIYVLSYDHNIQRSDDYGDHWYDVKNFPVAGAMNSLIARRGAFFKDSHGSLWVSGEGTDVYKTTDGGATWESAANHGSIPGVATNVMGSSLFFEDSRGTLWAARSNQPLQYTTDGINWKNSNTGAHPSNFVGADIAFLEDADHTLWAQGNGNAKLEYSKNGIDWFEDSTSVVSNDGSKMFLDPNNNIWKVGAKGMEVKLSGQKGWVSSSTIKGTVTSSPVHHNKGTISLKSFFKSGSSSKTGMYLTMQGINSVLEKEGLEISCDINKTGNFKKITETTIPINEYGQYDFKFEVKPTSGITLTSGVQTPEHLLINFEKGVDTPQNSDVKTKVTIPAHNGEDGKISYDPLNKPEGVKLELSIDGKPSTDKTKKWVEAAVDSNDPNKYKGETLTKKNGPFIVDFKWVLDDCRYWKTTPPPALPSVKCDFVDIGDFATKSADSIKTEVEKLINGKVPFDFTDWTVDSFNKEIKNTVKHLVVMNTTKDFIADLTLGIKANTENELEYKVSSVEYKHRYITKDASNKDVQHEDVIPNSFFPLITKTFKNKNEKITPLEDLKTQKQAHAIAVTNAEKIIKKESDALAFDKSFTATNAYSSSVSSSSVWTSKTISCHQDYVFTTTEHIDDSNGKITLELNVLSPLDPPHSPHGNVEISGFIGTTELSEDKLNKAILGEFKAPFAFDELTPGVFNDNTNDVVKKIHLKVYGKTTLDLTVHITAHDDHLSYTVDQNILVKNDGIDVDDSIKQNVLAIVKNWTGPIKITPSFLTYNDILKMVTNQSMENELKQKLISFESSKKIVLKINGSYSLELMLDVSVSTPTKIRYEVDSYELKYKGNSLARAKTSPILKSIEGKGGTMDVDSSVSMTFPQLVELDQIASKSIIPYVEEKYKYFDFGDWTVDSFNNDPANRTRTLKIYGKHDTSAELEIYTTATSENKLSYEVKTVTIKNNGVVQTNGVFAPIADKFRKQKDQITTIKNMKTEKQAQKKAAANAQDDVRIALKKIIFDYASLASEEKAKQFLTWTGKPSYIAYHQTFQVKYDTKSDDPSGEIVVATTVRPKVITGTAADTDEVVENIVGGFMGLSDLSKRKQEVKDEILKGFIEKHFSDLTAYLFNEDIKDNTMLITIKGFGGTTAELTLSLKAISNDKVSYTIEDVVIRDGNNKEVSKMIAGNIIAALKKWTGDVDLNPGFLTEEEYEKNLVIKNFKANPNELASEVINAKNTGVSKAVKGEYEFENADFRIDYTPDDETGEVLGKVTRKGSSSNVQETISGFLKFKAFADAVKTKDLESKLLSALDKYEDSKTFNFKINDDYALELTVAVLPKDDNTISYSVSGFDVKHNGKSLSNAQNSATLKALLKIKGDIKVLETNTKLLDVIYEKLHGESRRLDMSQLTKAASAPKPKPTVDLDEVTKELGEFYISGEQSGSAKLLEKNNAPDDTGFEFEFQVMDNEKPLSEPTKTLPVNLRNGEHVKITSVLKDGYQVKGKMPEKDIPVANLKEDKSIDATKLTKATEIKEVPEAAKPASKSNGLMIGLVVAGSVTGLILIGLLAFMIAKKRKKRS